MNFLASWKLWEASPICLMLFKLCVRAAAARTFWTAGTSSATKIAMIAITTNSSMSVKPIFLARVNIEYPFLKKYETTSILGCESEFLVNGQLDFLQI